MSRFDNNCLWITGGLDDRFPRAVLVGVVGGDGEACHLGVADVLDAGIPDDAAEGNLIELFHFVTELKGY